jgi:hypothetical protein
MEMPSKHELMESLRPILDTIPMPYSSGGHPKYGPYHEGKVPPAEIKVGGVTVTISYDGDRDLLFISGIRKVRGVEQYFNSVHNNSDRLSLVADAVLKVAHNVRGTTM